MYETLVSKKMMAMMRTPNQAMLSNLKWTSSAPLRKGTGLHLEKGTSETLGSISRHAGLHLEKGMANRHLSYCPPLWWTKQFFCDDHLLPSEMKPFQDGFLKLQIYGLMGSFHMNFTPQKTITLPIPTNNSITRDKQNCYTPVHPTVSRLPDTRS